MTRWKIVGASRTSAAPVELSIDAPTLAEAEQQASEMGVLIATITAERALVETGAAKPVYIAPTAQPETSTVQQAPGVQTIQQTSKEAKGHMLGGCLLFIASSVVACGAISAKDKDVSGLMIFLAMVGLVWWGIARAWAWWHHG